MESKMDIELTKEELLAPCNQNNLIRAKSIAWKERVSEHERELVYLIKNNAEIRRLTALGIIKYLTDNGEIKGAHKYIRFLWNKFQVIVEDIKREYRYTEIFFLNALIDSFEVFRRSAYKTIEKYINEELNINESEKVAIEEDIKDIVSLITTEDTE